MKLKIKITLLSDTLIGSGEGYGGNIDSDVVFDEYGIPYIPARRIKGCLRDSYEEILSYLNTNEDKTRRSNSLFGKIGENEQTIHFENLYLNGYKEMLADLKYLFREYPETFNKERIINHYTILRNQTSIEDSSGIAQNGSLRTIRVLKQYVEHEELVFIGSIENIEQELEKELLYAVTNLHYLGIKRNRGFGKVKCQLVKNEAILSIDRYREEFLANV